SRLSCPPAPGRSAGASPPAPETRSTKTGSGSRQTPPACSPHRKSTKPGRPHPAPPPAESTPPTPAVQPCPLAHFLEYGVTTLSRRAPNDNTLGFVEASLPRHLAFLRLRLDFLFATAEGTEPSPPASKSRQKKASLNPPPPPETAPSRPE